MRTSYRADGRQRKKCSQDGPVAVDSEAIDAFNVAANLLVGAFKD